MKPSRKLISKELKNQKQNPLIQEWQSTWLSTVYDGVHLWKDMFSAWTEIVKE